VIVCPASRIIRAAAAMPAPAMPVKWMRMGQLIVRSAGPVQPRATNHRRLRDSVKSPLTIQADS
jgi:hypothetical protein